MQRHLQLEPNGRKHNEIQWQLEDRASFLNIYLRVDRELATRVRRPRDIQPDTSAPLGPEARKRITLPGREKSKRK
jgi:hypothetical protein